eukprot:363066-Chlamydomonas_euryale.AAC.10
MSLASLCYTALRSVPLNLAPRRRVPVCWLLGCPFFPIIFHRTNANLAKQEIMSSRSFCKQHCQHRLHPACRPLAGCRLETFKHNITHANSKAQ